MIRSPLPEVLVPHSQCLVGKGVISGLVSGSEPASLSQVLLLSPRSLAQYQRGAFPEEVTERLGGSEVGLAQKTRV